MRYYQRGLLALLAFILQLLGIEGQVVTNTVLVTQEVTVTSCADTITNCPATTMMTTYPMTTTWTMTSPVSSSTSEAPSSTPEVPSSTSEVPGSTSEVPSSTPKIPSSSLVVPSSTPNTSSSTPIAFSSTSPLSVITPGVPSITLIIAFSSISTPEVISPAPTSPAASTVTVRIPVGTCPLPSSTPIVVPYTTTDSSGSIYTTSSISWSTAYPGTEITYTTTNSLGSSVVTSSFSIYTVSSPTVPPPSTHTSIYETTNSLGSTITTTSTSISNPTTSDTAAAAASSPCPASIAASWFTPGGTEFLLFCTTEFYYNDLPAVNSSTFAECIEACVAYAPEAGGLPCVAATWEAMNINGANCYLKSAIQDVVYGAANLDSAKLVNYNAPPDVAVSVYTSVSTASNTGVSTSTSPTTYSSYQSPSPCPYTNQSIYTDTNGVEYMVECGEDYEGNDLPSVNVESFAPCMLACSQYIPAPFGNSYDEPCIGVTYVGFNPNGNNCYLKSSITRIGYAGGQYRLHKRQNPVPFYDSARRVGFNPASSISSSIVHMTTTGSSTTSTTPAAPAPTSGEPCPAANSTTYSSSPSRVYRLSCGVSFNYDDLTTSDAPTFVDCMASCDKFIPNPPGQGLSDDQPCVAVTFITNESSGNSCYLHSGIGGITYNANDDSAELLSYLSSSYVSSSTSTSSSSGTTSSTSSSSSTTSSTSLAKASSSVNLSVSTSSSSFLSSGRLSRSKLFSTSSSSSSSSTSGSVSLRSSTSSSSSSNTSSTPLSTSSSTTRSSSSSYTSKKSSTSSSLTPSSRSTKSSIPSSTSSSSTSTSSSAASSSTSSSGSSLSSSSSSSSSLPSSTSTSIPSSAASSTSSPSSPPSGSTPIDPCPIANGTYDTANGYYIYCGYDIYLSDLPNSNESTAAVTFSDCVQACNDYVEVTTPGAYGYNEFCIGVTFVYAPQYGQIHCYMKSDTSNLFDVNQYAQSAVVGYYVDAGNNPGFP